MGIMSFGLLLQSLGLKLIIAEDAEMMQKLAHRYVRRQQKNVRRGALPLDPVAAYKISFARKGARAALRVVTSEMRRQSGRRGGLARLESTTGGQRSRWARRAARARWHGNAKRKTDNGHAQG